jgi:hypothetical protein
VEPVKPIAISLVSLILFAVALTWPALYNGFPLVFSDTGTYLATLTERIVPIDRPIYYGVFVGAAALLLGLPAVPFIQGLAVSYVSLLFFRWLAPDASRAAEWLAIAAIALLTPASWIASWLMPDVFGGLVILAPLLLLLAHDRLRPLHKILLCGTLLFALISHSGNVLLFVVFGACATVAGAMAIETVSRRAVALPAVLGLTAIFLSMLPNAINYGRWTMNPGSQAFIAARLVGDGFMQRYLAIHCPAEPTGLLCDRQADLAGITNNDFLWDKVPSPGDATGVWKERAHDYRDLNFRVIADQFGGIALQSASNIAQLLVRTELGNDPIDHNFRTFSDAQSVSRRIALHFPEEQARYDASRQQTGTLRLQPVNWLHRAWTWASYVLLAAAAVVAWRRNDRLLVVTAGLVFLGLVLNAAVHGALSGVYTRYQAKVTWIPTLVAIASLSALLHNWRAHARSADQPRFG